MGAKMESDVKTTTKSSLGNRILGSPDDLAAELQKLAHAIQAQLGTVAQTAFFVGDGLQRAVIDEIFDLLTPKTWTPANLWRTGSRMARQTIMMARSWTTGDAAGLILQELRNKLDVFTLVKNLTDRLNLPKGEFVPLQELVSKSYALPAFEALWAVEGVGHYYADTYWKTRGVPKGLLTQPDLPVDSKSMLMLHAGIGLAFADRLLGDLTEESTREEVRDALLQFIELCQNNSRQGYLGAAIESLGLVTRDFYPDLFPIVRDELQETAPEWMGFFWHGAGRALYFSRQYFLPGLCVWCDVDQIARTDDERVSALAGLSWAATLVNMRHPAISENQLRLYIDQSPLARGYSNGVMSTTIMRSDTTPGEPFVTAFLQHKPGSAEIAGSWQEHITVPGTSALDSVYPVLQQNTALDQVFRYQDLHELKDQLLEKTSP
jgi:hypothetical protein